MTQAVPHVERYEIPMSAYSGGSAPISMRIDAVPYRTRIEQVPVGSGYGLVGVIHSLCPTSGSDYTDRFFTVVNTNQNVTNSPSGTPRLVGDLDFATGSLHVFEINPLT